MVLCSFLIFFFFCFIIIFFLLSSFCCLFLFFVLLLFPFLFFRSFLSPYFFLLFFLTLLFAFLYLLILLTLVLSRSISSLHSSFPPFILYLPVVHVAVHLIIVIVNILIIPFSLLGSFDQHSYLLHSSNPLFTLHIYIYLRPPSLLSLLTFGLSIHHHPFFRLISTITSPALPLTSLTSPKFDLSRLLFPWSHRI